ncbi:hypothetical protein J6590_047990 [Homalodisca vitripennis]|nr:hypothetical protein J6590_047990 [Homalodisca vitripennis]
MSPCLVGFQGDDESMSVQFSMERGVMWWFNPLFLGLVTLFLYLPIASGNTRPPFTSVAQGRLKGRWFVTRGNRTVAGFLGIPYASPPVGALRFKSPQPPSPWEGVLSATEDKPGCPQKAGTSNIPLRARVTSEDCLYISVYTPDVMASHRLPVLVYIYGGSFEVGTSSSSSYGPDYLLDEDVILVVFSWRLGILGFLSLEHPVLPGNLGLKDQRAALRWIKENIPQFGGDPEKITIFGESTGAASLMKVRTMIKGNIAQFGGDPEKITKFGESTGAASLMKLRTMIKGNIAQFGGDPEKITIFGESTGAASVHYHLIFTAHEASYDDQG